MKLGNIAHSRTGDKGNLVNISVIVYDQKHFKRLVEVLTPEAVISHFGERIKGGVDRYLLPQLGAMNFVCHDALEGGVTSSTLLDKHGKSMSSYLLEMEVGEV